MSFAYSFRPCSSEDFEFVKRLHRDTLKEYVAQIWGWDDDVQEKLVRERFDPRKLRIIQSEGRDIGVLQLETRSEEWFLANIQLVPACQRRGWGSAILGELIREADRAGISLALSVLKPNPAKRLYERLGFNVSSEDEVRYFMRREPVASK